LVSENLIQYLYQRLFHLVWGFWECKVSFELLIAYDVSKFVEVLACVWFGGRS